MDNKPEIKQDTGDNADHESVQSSWPPPILPDGEGPISIKPARSFIEKVKAQSKVLGWFAVAGMPYGIIIAFLSFDAVMFQNQFGQSHSDVIVSLSEVAIIPASLIGLPVGLIAGFIFGLLRRTTEAWTLVGFALGGGISLLIYYYSQLTFIGGIATSTSSIIKCAVPVLLTTMLSEALRRDYASAHQRMPMVARLKELDSWYD